MMTNFWMGKKVLLTGHTGFKGSWMTLYLQTLGAEVTGFSLPPNTNPSLFELAGVVEGITSIEGDIRSYKHILDVLQATKPDIVFHFAAQALVRLSYEQPLETYQTNIMGTVHLLEAIRHVKGIRVVLCITSDKCYENRESGRAYGEDDPMGGFDPYSSSKGCDELIIAAYRRSFFPPDAYDRHGVALASGRAGNVIGGGDWARDRLVVDIMNAFTAGQTAFIRNTQAVRPWQHVLEPLNGYMRLAEKLWAEGPRFTEGWNFGPEPNAARPVAWIADRLARLWGKNAAWEQDAGSHPHEAQLLMLDTSKASAQLDWHPRLDLEQTLEWVVEWYQGYHQGCSPRMLTTKQISRYEELPKK